MICPNDTNGDGDCGQPACPYCGPQATDRTRLLADLDTVVRGNWDMRRAAGERIAERFDRLDRLEAVVRAFGLHEPDCPLFIEIRDEVGHSGKYYPTKTCTCWLSKTKEPT